MFRKKYMWLPLLFIGTLVLVSSCLTKKGWERRYPCTGFDSTIVRIDSFPVHDTVMIPYNDITFDTSSPCPPNVVYHKEITSKNLTGIVDISGGKIRFTCKEDSLKAVIEGMKTQKTITKINKQVIHDTQYKTHWYDIACRWILFIIFLVAVVDLGYTFLKSKV